MKIFNTQIPVNRRTPTKVKGDKAVCLPDFVFMEYGENRSLENLTCWFEGVFYNEEWKPITGFSNYYISSFGRVKSTKYCKLVILSQSERKRKGYYKLQLCENNFSKTYAVHRIVIKHFAEKVKGKEYCNHKDVNKRNNFYKNLEWCTIKENSKHAFRMGCIDMPDIRGIKNGRSVLTEKDVREIMAIGKSIGATKLSKMYGVCKSQIHEIRRGNTWKHITLKEVSV